MVIRSFLRRILRRQLKILTRATLAKHQPDIIAVVGSGPTGILRETLYTLLHENYPTRRNLESPESEFSVPLTILGCPRYPENDRQWLALIFQICRQFLTTRPYFHLLVLEMGTDNLESLAYWLEITRPKFIVVSGQTGVLQRFDTSKTTIINCSGGWDGLNYANGAVSALASYYKIPEEQVRQLPEKVTLPISRMTLRPGKEGRLILNSTYYYYPTPLTAVREVASALPTPVVYVLDESLIPEEGPQIKDQVLTVNHLEMVKKYKTVVVRGPKAKMRPVLDSL